MNLPPDDPSPPRTPYASAQLAAIASSIHGWSQPTQIGVYHILEPIGEGGMGTVYKAEQREPIQRLVAVKVIKLGLDTRAVISRFQAERQALAMMDHPNVARVIDAGATADGRPYFVMEYVAGEPITDFADRLRLTLEQRLELFVQACSAVQHAHQKAIIHRDLKPSNILAVQQDGKSSVKVIDFGVAKALDHTTTAQTSYTEIGQLLGTLEYMSPEQADDRGEDVDTRTDIYSLGVVLYELLTGVLPFDAARMRTAGHQEIRRIIREVVPPRPSTKLSSLGEAAREVAASRQMALSALGKQLHRELDWIPLKAMRKDREQRYATATEFAEDIRSYLSNRPLRAGPESSLYRLRKFLHRNKRGVAASAAMLLLLLTGTVATTWQAIRATRAEREALSATKNVQEVNRFLTDDLLASAAPQVTRGREMTVREAVDRAAESIDLRFKDRPLTEATVRSVLGDTYSSLGEQARGLAQAQAALEIYKRERGPDHEQTILATCAVGRNLAELNRHDEAEPLMRDALVRSQRLLGENHPATIDCVGALAMTLRMQRRFAEAEPLYRRVLEGERQIYGPQSEQAAQSLNSLAVLLNTQERAAEAEPLYRESLAIRDKLLGRDHPSYLTSLANFARVLEVQGKWVQAEAVHREVLQLRRRVLKDDHPSTMLSMNNLAAVLAQLEKYDEAEALHREALERRRRVLGEEDPETLQSLHNLGRTLTMRGKYAEAEDYHRQALEKRQKVLGATHRDTLAAASSLANVFELQNRWADAEPLLGMLYDTKPLVAFAPRAQAILSARYGCCLANLSKLAQAEPVLLDAHRRLTETGQSVGDRMRNVLTALIKLCDEASRPQEAATWRAALAATPPEQSAATRSSSG